jgi:hypothetical protein
MTIKDNIINELEINPNISYDEIIIRFPDIKKKHFSNTRWSWRKNNSLPKKGKGSKKGKVSSASKGTDKTNSGETLSDNFIKTCIYFYKDIRGKDDKIKDDIDMEEFLLIGKTLKNSD